MREALLTPLLVLNPDATVLADNRPVAIDQAMHGYLGISSHLVENLLFWVDT
jgi:hypothetical protein